MTDIDTLIVTFQTQLSDVMETVVKTAVYEVTRLVEDGFLEEVKRRNQEVESLRMQLQWAENKLSDGKERKNMRCAGCTKEDVELSAADKDEEQPDGLLTDGGVKTEGDSVEHWTRSCRQEVSTTSPQAAGVATASLTERTSQTPEEVSVLPDVDVKKEIVTKLSCSSVNLGGWSGALDGEAGCDIHSTSEAAEAQPKQTQENGEELLRDVIKQDRQTSAGYVFPEESGDTHMATDPSHASSLERNSDWTCLTVSAIGVLQNHRLATDKDCDPAKSRGHLKHTEHKVSNFVSEDVHAHVTPGRDQIATSGSPKARQQNSTALGVTIKQEVIADSGDSEDASHIEGKLTPYSCSVKQHTRVSSEAQKQNHISHKASAQEVMKLHSKVGTGLRLQAAIQHLHRPTRKPSSTLSHTTTALSVAHSQAANFNRLPCTSKAAPSPPLSVQRVHLGDKQSAALNRAGPSWVSIKTQHQSGNSHHANSLSHLDSQPHAGPRHLLRCGQCGKCFPHPSNLKAHLQTHTGERPFCCSLCGRSFTKLSNLKAHRRVHTGERPYCCLACGKRFTQKCNLKRHQRIHLDV